MPSSPRAAAWSRLGALLRDRRVELDSRYRNRRTFVKETGLSYSVTSNIETGVREDYGGDTLRAIERAYRWQPGSVQRVLEGGDPEPINGTIRVSGVSVSTEPVSNADHVDAELARWIDDARRHGVDALDWDLNDPLERDIFTDPVFNWRDKQGMVNVLRAYRAQARERERGDGTDGPAGQ